MSSQEHLLVLDLEFPIQKEHQTDPEVRHYTEIERKMHYWKGLG